MYDCQSGDLTIVFEEREGCIALVWLGKSSAREPSRTLDPFFEAALAEALNRKCGLEMHFQQLQHFNSSTVGCLIKVVQDARTMGVKLVFHYDARVTWQRLNFDALRVFTKDNALFELKAMKDHDQATL